MESPRKLFPRGRSYIGGRIVNQTGTAFFYHECANLEQMEPPHHGLGLEQQGASDAQEFT